MLKPSLSLQANSLDLSLLNESKEKMYNFKPHSEVSDVMWPPGFKDADVDIKPLMFKKCPFDMVSYLHSIVLK